MIYLGDDRSSQRVLKLLEVLLSETAAADEKKQILQEDFEIKMTHNLESEVSGMCNLSDGIEERATARGIARGMAQGIEQGIARGRAQGIEQGIAQGMERGMAQGMERGMAQGMERGMAQGMEQGTVQSILSLMDSLKLTAKQAMEALKIPQGEQEKYDAMIKQMNEK
jgi:flagellar biosynthesis/type III secretory pathway protein FliH